MDLFMECAAELPDKMPGQRNHVVFPLTQRAYGDVKYVEPEVEILAESPFAYKCFQRAIRGGDKTNIGRIVLRAA